MNLKDVLVAGLNTVSTPPKHGTRWTGPGQGATVAELRFKLSESPQFSHAYSRGKPVALAAHDKLYGFVPDSVYGYAPIDSNARTNVALTGAPLTAEDLTRIEKAEVTG